MQENYQGTLFRPSLDHVKGHTVEPEVVVLPTGFFQSGCLPELHSYARSALTALVGRPILLEYTACCIPRHRDWVEHGLSRQCTGCGNGDVRHPVRGPERPLAPLYGCELGSNIFQVQRRKPLWGWPSRR